MEENRKRYEENKEKIEKNKKLKKDLEKKKRVVDDIYSMVVVIDERSKESEYYKMEDKMKDIGERWENICKWKEER
jgi:predicted RND superfamily exporter protein